MPRPFNYPKDASEFRKQFCVGEYSAKKKDWMFFRSALASSIHEEHGTKSKSKNKFFCVLVSFLSFEMTRFFALQFVFRCIQAVHVIRCCCFFSFFFSDFLIDCIGCVFRYLNLDKLNSICRVVSLTMIMK